MHQKWTNYYHRIAAHIPYRVTKVNGEEALQSNNSLDDTDMEMDEMNIAEDGGTDEAIRQNHNTIAPPISGKEGRPERKCLFHLL